MNSWSKNNYESYKKEEKHENCRKEDRYEDRYDEKRRDEKKCETFIKCGCPSSVTLPLIDVTAGLVNRSFTLASLNLDTSCICDPKIKLDFASNFVTSVLFTGAFSIQIFKQCKHQLTPITVGPSWRFDFLQILESETFSFFVCDSEACEGECCNYTVVATVTSPVTIGTLSINNATLAATVTCGENDCHKKCHRRDDY